MKIPKIIHQIWLGSAPIPDQFISYMESWKKLHPSWEFMLWRDDYLSRLEEQSFFNVALLKQERDVVVLSDILRLEILYLYGGVYVDMDVEPLRPIDPLLEGRDFFIGEEDRDLYCNAIMGSIPKNPLVATLLREIWPNLAMKRSQGITNLSELSGPIFISQLFNLIDVSERDRLILPKAFFYPYGYLEKERSSENFKVTSPDSYGIHHWAGSWVSTMEMIPHKENAYLGLKNKFKFFLKLFLPQFIKKPIRIAIIFFRNVENDWRVFTKRRNLIPGLQFRVNSDDDKWVIPELVDQNMYELEKLSSLIPGVGVLIDGGAHIGVLSLLWSKFFPEFAIYSFEPSPENFCLLQKNCAKCNRITLNQQALGLEEGVVELWDQGESGRWSLVPESFRADRLSLKVSVVSLERIICDMTSDSGTIVLKLDLEGYEAELIAGLSDRALLALDVIILEEHHLKIDHLRLMQVGFKVLFHPSNSMRHFVYVHDRLQISPNQFW